jgi:hypothetical protein
VKYYQGSEINRIQWTGLVKSSSKILVGKSEGKRALGRPGCGLDSFELKIQLQILMNMEINLCVLKKKKDPKFLAQVGDCQFVNTQSKLFTSGRTYS